MRVWGMTIESQVPLSPEDRAKLEGWVAGRNTPQKLVWRARITDAGAGRRCDGDHSGDRQDQENG